MILATQQVHDRSQTSLNMAEQFENYSHDSRRLHWSSPTTAPCVRSSDTMLTFIPDHSVTHYLRTASVARLSKFRIDSQRSLPSCALISEQVLLWRSGDTSRPLQPQRPICCLATLLQLLTFNYTTYIQFRIPAQPACGRKGAAVVSKVPGSPDAAALSDSCTSDASEK